MFPVIPPMTLRNLVFLLVLVFCVPGCGMWGWGWKSEAKPYEEPTVDHFTHSDPKEDEESEKEPAGSFAKTNGRTDDPGTGLSSRSREIERSLGYK